MIRAIVVDIEGTTTSISFVHDVLFPYSRVHLRSFVERHAADPRVRKALDDTRATVRAEDDRELDDAAALDVLERWIAEDRKHPALKSLQGQIWHEGYDRGELRSHVYADVPGALRRWRDAGLTLGVFSSGSIEAQQLLFAHTDHGDLSTMLSRWFDPTTVGPKREAASYGAIARAIELLPEDVLFLSDTEEELDAARAAGLATSRVVRDASSPSSKHAIARDFANLD